MKPLAKALLLTACQGALLLGLGGKYLYERATRPRFWLKTAPVDPNLPIRGRYVDLRVEVPVRGATMPEEKEHHQNRWFPGHSVTVQLVDENGSLMALPAGEGPDAWPGRVRATLPESQRKLPREAWAVRLQEPLACFIPERVEDPSRRAPGEELWVEVTLPRKGPLRPIRLAVKKDGKLQPLGF